MHFSVMPKDSILTRSRRVLSSVALLLLAACAVPDADRAIENGTGTSTAKPRIEDGDGALTLEQSHAILASLAVRADGTEILQRHLAIESAIAGTPLIADNAVQVLRDGPETFRAIATVIKGAKHDLLLEYYTIDDVILEHGEDGETRLSDLLLAKRHEGVAVSILYDSFGSSDTAGEFFERLSQAGVQLLEYHPVAPTNPVNILTLNNRDHRKILVADGAVAVVGGVNLSKDYESKVPGGSDDDEPARSLPTEAGAEEVMNPVAQETEEWRDTSIRIDGPAARELQTLFREHWQSQNGEPLPPALPAPKSDAKGNQVVRIIGSTPDEDMPRYYVTLISALRNAEAKVWVSASYFVPTPEEKEELIAAAERGVDVRLLLAGSSDSQEAVAAAQTHYTDLLEAGAKIYEVKDEVLHSKSVVIDGVWSAVGSSNFDHRSVLYNDEVDAIVLGAETAAELEKIFEEGMQTATQIDREAWEASRPFGERFRGFFARMWEHLL